MSVLLLYLDIYKFRHFLSLHFCRQTLVGRSLIFCYICIQSVSVNNTYVFLFFVVFLRRKTENNTTNAEHWIKKYKFSHFVTSLVSTLLFFCCCFFKFSHRAFHRFSLLFRSELGTDVSRQNDGCYERDARVAGNHRQVQGLAGGPHRVHLSEGHRPFQNR